MNIEILKIHPDAIISKIQTSGSAAVDLCAIDNHRVHAYSAVLIHTGIAIHINDIGIVGIVYPRSGNAIKHGITLTNSVGVIDSDYQGEIMVSLKNSSEKAFTVEYGDRIAQMVFQKIEAVQFVEVNEFTYSSVRGSGGFGSTGK